MISVLVQLIGGLFGGTLIGKIVHRSDMGVIWNALSAALGGITGGQLIGALIQIAAGIFLNKLLDQSMTRRRRSQSY